MEQGVILGKLSRDIAALYAAGTFQNRIRETFAVQSGSFRRGAAVLIARALCPYRRVVLRIRIMRFEENADMMSHRQFTGADLHRRNPGVLLEAAGNGDVSPLDDVRLRLC